MARKIEKTDEEWREALTPDQYAVARQKGTERAFTGAYWDHHGDGTYRCSACSAPLFDSTTKYDSGSGWPSFTQPMDGDAVDTEMDTSHGMRRTEVLCNACGAHLGHVFPDGPGPDGQRYCINSCSLDFQPRDAKRS